MSRIYQLLTELQKQGIKGQPTEQEALNILYKLPGKNSLQPKDGFDDRNDRRMELLIMQIQHPDLLKLKPARTADRIFSPLEKRKRKSPFKLFLEESKTGNNLQANVGLALLPDSTRIAIADMKAPAPLLRVRVRAIVCRNDDGNLTNGTKGQTKAQMAPWIDKLIDEVNVIFGKSGIELVFYPSSDIEIRNDTKLNQDFQLNTSFRTELYNGNFTPERYDEISSVEGPMSTFAYRNEVCKQYTNRLVLLFAEGTLLTAPVQHNWRRCKKCESLFFGDNQNSSRCPEGGQHDADNSSNFAVHYFSSDKFSVDVTSKDLQAGWRWCNKCQGMFSEEGPHVCPAGGQHDGSQSAAYVMDYISNTSENAAQIMGNHRQSGWRVCGKCFSMHYGQHVEASACPAGGQHITAGSSDYVLSTDQSHYRHIVNSPADFGFSGHMHGFVKLTAEVPLDQTGIEGYATFAAHEIGHYLSLQHTHGFIASLPDEVRKDDKADKLAYLKEQTRKFMEEQVAQKQVTRENILDALDGDRGSGIFDTPPDVSPDLFFYLNRQTQAGTNECSAVGTCTIELSDKTSVSFTPERSLVMSYFKHCMNFDHNFSPDQIRNMRKHLIEGYRRPLVAAQLGETATPNERVCAVWSPNTNGQAYVAGWKLADFKKKCAEMNKANFRLSRQQAYTRNGVTVYDGVFDPGTTPEHIIWGWTVDDFKKEDLRLHPDKWRLVHLESYLLPNKEVRVNAVWNQNYWITDWVQGFGVVDFEKQLQAWKQKKYQPVHLNAWQLGNGEVRYDAIARPLQIVYPHFLGYPEEAFRKLYDDMWNKQHKLLCLDCVRHSHGALSFNGIFVPDEKPQFITWNATREQVRENYDEMWATGMKLRSMNAVF